MTVFEGFPAELLDFYVGLEADNSKTYWQAHKRVYDEHVAAPMHALAAELAPRFGTPKLFRPYRDVRFSADKTPYKTHAALVVGSGSGALYLQVSADGMLIAGGAWQPGRDQLRRWRDLQDDPVVTADLDRALAGLSGAGFPLGFDAALKTAPRGYPRDHARIELLRLTSLTVSRHYDPAPWFETREAFDVVAAGWTQAAGWNDWIDRFVGPTAEEPNRPGGR